MSFNFYSLRDVVILCIYKFYKVVYGFLMMDFGIIDIIVVLGDLV